ncbi:FAD/NAD(P)-binding domain-containing protein [Ceraceosorus guamensis]|uniref:FAD/NAD(P)-binding domain-containing protein n=1 Tax=Ceraceosorus guamensis TaxID=1522189 RepID=A0A316VZ99_9BASI|nr:FAD/NAD(P)-binding domain-containing protein [Ceraceosorus guamensis]PWN42759.1 FAD/NAD(P)-binding domain-containing protein [Ceraceosorus guamensis]
MAKVGPVRVSVSSLDPLGIVSLVYQAIQVLIAWFFAPLPPSAQQAQKPLAKIAVIGAGITGISTAAHLAGHGFDVTIFEAGSEEKLGGIWANVNSSSGLQISSILYRWHPLVRWSKGYPKRDEILANVKRVWTRYGLDKKTRFNTPVQSVTRHKSSTDPAERGSAKWIINGDETQVFDGISVNVGTCGKPKRMELPGQEKFKGQIVHSSELDDVELSGKKVLVVGGGASGVEALELAVEKQSETAIILARSDKWIIPRFTVVDILLALQPFGRETVTSKIPEFLLKKLHYRDLEEKMAPTQGFYQDTPIVNTSCLEHIREGRADYQRGDVLELTPDGIEFNKRKRGQKKETTGEKVHYDADVIVVATGFEKPKIDFLPDDLFPGEYIRPNMYLQVFPVEDSTVSCTNSTFQAAVGTVGHVHIGIYARILALFVLEPETRPVPKDMRLWVDLIRWVKENAPGGELSFFTYMELCIWLVTFLFFRWTRIQFFFFVLFGLGFWSRDQAPDGKPAGKPRFHLSITKRKLLIVDAGG